MKSTIKYIIIFTCLAAAIGLGSVARAEYGPNNLKAPELISGGGKNYNVWPSGDLTGEIDIQNVQWAVDNVRDGGGVRLKAHDKFTGEVKAFNFGSNSVKITKDVRIIGEGYDGNGSPVTRVNGGHTSFLSPWPHPAPDSPGPDITIQEIHFDAAELMPVMINYSRSIRIIGNKVTNVKPYTMLPSTYRVLAGCEIGPHNYADPKNPGHYLHDILNKWAAGYVEIRDNYIDLAVVDFPQNLSTDYGQGIMVNLTVGAEVLVAGNTVKDCIKHSLAMWDNYADESGIGSTLVENNAFISSADGVGNYPRGPTFSKWFVNDAIYKNLAYCELNSNYIELSAASRGYGFITYKRWSETNGSQMLLFNNHFNVSGNSGHIAMVLMTSKVVLDSNIVEGQGGQAFVFQSYLGDSGSNNVILGNHMSDFTAGVEQVLLRIGTSGNYFGRDPYTNQLSPNLFGGGGPGKTVIKFDGADNNRFVRNEYVKVSELLWWFTADSKNNSVNSPNPTFPGYSGNPYDYWQDDNGSNDLE